MGWKPEAPAKKTSSTPGASGVLLDLAGTKQKRAGGLNPPAPLL
jgi:hypothetical protein